MKFFIFFCVLICILALLAGGEAKRKRKPKPRPKPKGGNKRGVTALTILKGIGKDLDRGKCQKLQDMCSDDEKMTKVTNFLANNTLGENELDGQRIEGACKVLTAYQKVIDKLEAKIPKGGENTLVVEGRKNKKKPKNKKPKNKKGNKKRGNKKGGKKSGEQAKGTVALGILTAIGSELNQGKCNQLQEICRDDAKMNNITAFLTKANLGENELNGTRLQRACKLLTNYQVVIDKLKGKMAQAQGQAEGQPKGAVALATLTAIGSELDEGKCERLQAICTDEGKMSNITKFLSNKNLGENEDDGKRIQDACKVLTSYQKVISKLEAKVPNGGGKTPKVKKPKKKKQKSRKPKSKKPKSKKQKSRKPKSKKPKSKKQKNKKGGNKKKGNKKGGKKPNELEVKGQEQEKPKGTAVLGVLAAIGSELSQGKCNQLQDICRDEAKMNNVVALLTKANLGENELNGTRLQRSCKLLTNYQGVIDKVKAKMAQAPGQAEGQPKGAVFLLAIGSELDEGKCGQLQAICSDESQMAKITAFLSNKDLGENEDDGKRILDACKMLTAYQKLIEKFKKMIPQQAAA